MVVDIEDTEMEEEEEGGGGQDGDIDIEDRHQQDIYGMVHGIVHGIGLVEYVKKDVQIQGMENGGVNIRDQDQMIAGLQQIVMGVDNKSNKIFLINKDDR